MPLTYLPDQARLFEWDPESVQAAEASDPTLLSDATLLLPEGPRTVTGIAMELLPAAISLEQLGDEEAEKLSPTISFWRAVVRYAMTLMMRCETTPVLDPVGEQFLPRFRMLGMTPHDRPILEQFSRSMPLAAHAVPLSATETAESWSAPAILRCFLDDFADALIRRCAATTGKNQPVPPLDQFYRSLSKAFEEVPRKLLRSHSWQDAAELRSVESSLLSEHVGNSLGELGVRVHLPDAEEGDEQSAFRIELLVGDSEHPEDAASAEVFLRDPGPYADPAIHSTARTAIVNATHRFSSLGNTLVQPDLGFRNLSGEQLIEFLEWDAPAMAGVGMFLVVPKELSKLRANPLSLHAALKPSDDRKEGGGIDFMLDLNVALGGEALSPSDLDALIEGNRQVIRFRDKWMRIDLHDLAAAREQLKSSGQKLSRAEALRTALTGTIDIDGEECKVTPCKPLKETLDKLRRANRRSARPPKGFKGELRPYQRRGLAWLGTMGELGLGACLADDMGLGKTVQFLAHMAARRRDAPDDARPSLLVVPTSVLGNWQREAARFTPTLSVKRHYGPERARDAEDLVESPGQVILTSYGVLQRDEELLTAIEWATLALDEAQNIKTATTRTAKAARAIPCDHRIALSGTPIENRLSELWSIYQFLNPGLLGSKEHFNKNFARPIERRRDRRAGKKLRSVVAPFLLRRLKTDPKIIKDLPEKDEQNVVCTLTAEQASLYQAAVEEALDALAKLDGMKRRGRILALLTALKQICNHPAQYLKDKKGMAGRSGKLDLATEMLADALATDDKVLLFTQFRKMGDLLVDHLRTTLDTEPLFLHGGTSATARDKLVANFQDREHPSRVFVLSLKAGGTGLNLTTASRVFHFDRWWNPAVEDQATDRAFRIGQKQHVFVHKFVCGGTIEERIDHMLTDKRALADQIVGTGEAWITEMSDADLADLFRLSSDSGTSQKTGRKRRASR